MEIELKLLLDPADVAAFRRHPLLKRHAIAKPRVQQLTSIYFDTPDLHFRRHDAALRVRRVDRRWIQTLKGGGQVVAGLHQRDEWESRVGSPHPDLAALRDLVGHAAAWAKTLAAPELAERLVPIFVTKFRRTVWLLQLAHGATVELALDQGEVTHDTTRTPISEIELELKSGDSSELFDLALQLQDVVPLRVSNISKAERGYAQYAPQPLAVVKRASIELSSTISVGEGLQIIVGNCLTHVQGNETGVEHGVDPESVHEMRVGLRRLNSALRLFAGVAPCPAELLAELAWLATTLGAARDWEVFAGSTLAAVAGACPDEPELALLQQAALTVAQGVRSEAAVAVGSERYARLLLAVCGWAYGARRRALLAEHERAALAAPLAKFAAQMLMLYHGKLTKRCKRLQEESPQERHRARIAAKKFRYATEFFQSLYPVKRVRPFIDALSTLQDALGWLNDAAVAGNLLRQLALSHPETACSAGFVRGYLTARTERGVRKLGRLWQQFAPMKLPCRK
jgi:inorganic triphosphatase YgiF